MKPYVSALLAGSNLLALAISLPAPARAQDAPAERRTVGEGPADIVVTARRRDERLQDVPQTIVAVTSQELERLNVLNTGDLGKIVAGLQIDGSNVSMRGITFDLNTGASPTVATYFNDAPIQNGAFFFSNFDVGQIEVLRGPQGTIRGISSPSGAITYTTRRPDLASVGGFANFSITNREGLNLQGAINLPIITDKLAIRIAGLIDRDDNNGVNSLNSDDDPHTRSEAVRVSLRFEPSDSFSANLVGHHLVRRARSFTQVFGPGSPGLAPITLPNYNGPAITPGDNLSVQDEASITDQFIDFITLQANWLVGGQRISYVGSYQYANSKLPVVATDTGNSIPGYEIMGAAFPRPAKATTHELRLQSVERIAGAFDYGVGAFFRDYKLEIEGSNGVAAFLPGAFGSPLGPPVLGAPNIRYQLETNIYTLLRERETSFFANVTGHFFDDKLEVSGGARYIIAKNRRNIAVSTTTGFIAQPLPALFCGLAGGQFGATYANVCDIEIPGAVAVASDQTSRDKPLIWNASLSYRITPDFMVYASAGSSWRQGPTGIGISNGNNDPLLNSYIFLGSEKSTAYEAGAKWSFLGGRGRLALAYYHQDFKGLIFSAGNVRYLSYSGAPTPSVLSTSFNANVPAKIDGIDFEASIDVTSRWNIGGNVSWQNGRLSNALIPCNDGDFDGVADTTIPDVQDFLDAGTLLGQCRTSTGSSSAPKWNLRLQSQYVLPVSEGMDAFARGLLIYQPKNPNSSLTYTVPAYALADLFVGLRDTSRAWEVAVYGKNITNTRKILTMSAGNINPPGGLRTTFGDTGYRTITRNLPREFGLNVRYQFGS